MDAGKLNREIAIQMKSVTFGGFGEPIDTWVTVFTRWAHVITTGGGEFYAAQKLNETTSCVFSIRFTNRVKTTYRIVYGSKTLEILAINDVDGAHEELLISAKEVT